MNTRLCSASNFAQTWRRWAPKSVLLIPVLKFNSGRSANVRASFGTLHSLSLRYVKLHQVASASAAGDFKLDMMLNMCFDMCYDVEYVF